MSFKQNLLKKIKLDQMRLRVLVTLGSSGSSGKVDKNAMRRLLDVAGYRHKKHRSLNLYLPEGTGEWAKQNILVLDNELAMYNSTVDDVALRKDPTLKEMISIKNAMKILNDKDVIISRRDTSLETVYSEGVSRLDLSFTKEDIQKLEYDGRSAVEWNDTEAILEVMNLYAELLSFYSEPKSFKLDGYAMTGAYSRGSKKEELFGPSVVFSIGNGVIKLIDDVFTVDDKEAVKKFQDTVLGRRDPAAMGPKVIQWLSGRVIAAYPDIESSSVSV